MSEKVIKIFYSYSRKDLELRNILEDHLSALRRANKISTWHDLELEPGTEWERDLQHQLDTADIILLLVSRNFIASEYCYSTELKRAIERHNEGTARVIPIILRHCNWNIPEVPFSKLNVLPTHAKPITSWEDPDEAFTIVAQQIQKTVEQLRAKKRSAEPPEKEEPKSENEIDLPTLLRQDLRECDPAKILFIKNVKDPEKWAYSLDRMQQPKSRVFELMWRSSSHGVELPKAGDLMILHQGAKVTHVVEFLDGKVRQTDSNSFRWVRAVWIAEHDWNQLPHQQEILGFNPNYSDGNTHAFNSPNFSTFRSAWSSLEDFQKHIFNRLTQPATLQLTQNKTEQQLPTNRQRAIEVAKERQRLEQTKETDSLLSDKGVNYIRLRDLLKAGQWKEADQETAMRMGEAMGQQKMALTCSENIRDFPLTDLRTIDQLWARYSNGRFGFSVQRRVLDYTFSNSKVTPETCFSDYDRLNSVEDFSDRLSQRWHKFGKLLGWYENDQWTMNIDYTEETTNKPEGYLPLLGQPPMFHIISANRHGMLWWWALLLRLKPWKV